MSRSIFLFFSLVTLINSEVYFSKGSPHVKLTPKSAISGNLEFSRDGRPYTSFTGIPYATVSERFEESQLIKYPNWEGIKSFKETGPVCPQQEYGDIGQGLFGNEDCLNLNVYVPMNNPDNENGYPVMVWIHGGGFTYGSGALYGAKFYIDENLIVVTISYRLGVFGFLSTGDELMPGNNGLKDQVNALKWVQQNIKSFGGDPSKVTISGESAGSASVSYLLISPLANNLFQAAISQSASALGDYPYDPIPKENAVKLAEFVNCPSKSSSGIVNCLRKLSTEELNRAQFAYKSSFPKNLTSFNFMPTVELSSMTSTHQLFLSVPPIRAFQTGTDIPLMKVPWMIGVTEDEGCSSYAGAVLVEDELVKKLDIEWDTLAPDAFFYRKYFPVSERSQVSEKLRKFYFGQDGRISLEKRMNLTNLYSDQLITHGVWKAAMESAKRGNTVYLYEYAYPGPASAFGGFFKLSEEEAKMVGHADELQHQFNMEGFFLKPDADSSFSDDERFSKNLVKLWASFIKHHKPQHSWQLSSSSTSIWEPISKAQLDGESPIKWFRLEGNQSAYVEVSHDLQKRMQFWDDLWKYHFAPAIQSLYKKQILQNGNDVKTEL